jgi:hypothetical protein
MHHAGELLDRVRDSVRRMLHVPPAAGTTDAALPLRAEIAAAAVKAIRREIPNELLAVVESSESALSAGVAERLQLPLRPLGAIAAWARGDGLVVEHGAAVEVRHVRREGEAGRVRLRIHTTTGHRRHSAPVVTSEIEVVVARQPNRRRWRLVSRRIVLIA